MHIPYISLIKKENCADSKYYTLNIYGGIFLMSKLDFLEVSRNFKSYYRTLRDVHFYLTNDSELNRAELQAVSRVLSKLIYGFIRIKGIAFREMNREQYEQEFHLFHEDFLNVIQNSGENNVDFDQFIVLIDEIIGIAVKRSNALGKIKKGKQESLAVELAEVNTAVIEELDEIETNIEEEEEEEIVDDMNEEAPEVETVSAAIEVEDVIVEAAIVEPEKAEEEKPEKEEIIADVIIEEQVTPVLAEKVEKPRIDGGPVNNSFNDYESSDHFRFRPRKRKHR
jgi:hypothetical protein